MIYTTPIEKCMCSTLTWCFPVHDVTQKLNIWPFIILAGVKRCLAISLSELIIPNYVGLSQTAETFISSLRYFFNMVCSFLWIYSPCVGNFSTKPLWRRWRHSSFDNPLFVLLFLWFCSLKASLSVTECNSRLSEVKKFH